jgi:AbrB family looped-hinge helix DNA binding protein
MPLPQSRVSARGRISIPAEIRRKLQIGAGSVLEWDEQGGEVVVRKAGGHTFQDIHAALFDVPPKPRTIEELKESIGRHLREKHSR